MTQDFALPETLMPVPDRSGLDEPFWTALAEGRLVVQRCRACGQWQWGPEWICSACASFDVAWEEVPREHDGYRGEIYSWERVWHPTNRGLADAVPYVVVLVSLPASDGVRMVGNLLGDPMDDVTIGATVRAVIETHNGYSLVQWERS